MSTPPHRARTVVLVAAACVLQLAVLLIVAVSGLVAPPWAVMAGAVVWLASLIPFVRALRRRRWASLLVPLAVLGCWVVVVTVGDLTLEWTA